MDEILIRGLRARCILGVNEEERRERQDVTIHVTLFVDLRKVGLSDRLEDTIDYRALKKRILATVEASRFYLVEALAEAVAELALADRKAAAVRVEVEKPYALRFADSAAVRITRRQGR